MEKRTYVCDHCCWTGDSPLSEPVGFGVSRGVQGFWCPRCKTYMVREMLDFKTECELEWGKNWNG